MPPEIGDAEWNRETLRYALSYLAPLVESGDLKIEQADVTGNLLTIQVSTEIASVQAAHEYDLVEFSKMFSPASPELLGSAIASSVYP